MTCVARPRLPIPDLTALLPALPDIPFVPGIPGVPSFCCTLPLSPLPGSPYIIPLGAALLALGPGAEAVTSAIQNAIQQLQVLLDQIPPVNCPLD